MEFNISKYKVLRVTRIKSVIERDYFLGGTRLERVNVEKDLGVLIRQNRSNITDIKTKKLLYIAWARPRLDYASIVWSPHTKRNIIKLDQIQRRATRFTLGKDISENERLRKLNLLSLCYRKEICDLVFFFKCFKNFYSLNILELRVILLLCETSS